MNYFKKKTYLYYNMYLYYKSSQTGLKLEGLLTKHSTLSLHRTQPAFTPEPARVRALRGGCPLPEQPSPGGCDPLGPHLWGLIRSLTSLNPEGRILSL